MSVYRATLRLTLVVSIVLVSSLLFAAKVKQMNLLELVDRAGRIFSGTVIDVTEGAVTTPGGRELPCTVYTVRIQDRIRGPESETVTFSYVGSRQMKVHGKYGYKFEVPGLPGYSPGEEVLLFLTRESQVQLTSPVGLFQGSFRVYRDPATGRRMVVNGSQNGGLFKGITVQSLGALQQFSQTELNLMQVKSGPVEYDAFVSLVRKLAQR